MQLHNTSQYAIRLVSYIAKKNGTQLCSAKELSEILNIPYKFLTKIMASLVRSQLITSVKGREGGYKLAKKSSDIKVIDILNIFNERVNENKCVLGIGLCDSENKCALHDQWIVPKELIQIMFEETTMDNLEGDNYKI